MSANPAIHEWKSLRIWVVGASSGIGAALTELLLSRGATLAISARNGLALQKLSAGRALCMPLDVSNPEHVASAAQHIRTVLGGMDMVVWLAGTYTPMSADSFDLKQAKHTLQINFEGVLNGLEACLPDMLKQGKGSVVLVSSVAGYRGLPNALAYGPSKAALINLAETLYLDCQPRGLGIFLVNPGFVKTPLTEQNQFSMPALISPQEAARCIVEGLEAGRFEIHFPRRFTLWLKLLRLLPYRLYFFLVSRATRPST